MSLIREDPMAGWGQARVFQVAKVLEREPANLVGELRERYPDAVSVNSWLSADRVAEILRDHIPRALLSTAEDLIVDSFAVARATKSEWDIMLLAVLKNRMIAASEGTFDEADYGAPNMASFALKFPTLLAPEIDGAQGAVRIKQPDRVPEVAITPQTQTSTTAVAGKAHRIRTDLWNAVMDYRSGFSYVWVLEEGVARPLEPGDTQTFLLPTLSNEDVRAWRQELLERVRAEVSDGEVIRETETWASSNAPTQLLPFIARSTWNSLQNSNVERRLRDFFELHELEIPSDLIAEKTTSRRQSSVSGSTKKGEIGLRMFLHRCIDAMTEAEMKSLLVPVGIAARVTNGPKF
jgi:hypothetical protein